MGYSRWGIEDVQKLSTTYICPLQLLATIRKVNLGLSESLLSLEF